MNRFVAAALLIAPAVFAAGPLVEDIPAPFPESHASTVIELANGEILASWFGGTKEGNPDTGIWVSRRSASGWGAPVEVVKEPNVAMYNPVLFYTKDHRLWLYYKFGVHPVSWSAGRMYSTDEGKTWSQPEHLPAGLYGPIRAKPLVMADGTIVSGTSVEAYRTWAVWIERSTDNGKTWTKAGPITVPIDPSKVVDSKGGNRPVDWDRTDGIIQPSVISMGGKHLRLYARSTSKTGKICIADSNDAGVTWTQGSTIDVPNPNSGIDAIALKDGRIVLVYNNTPKGRTPLNLAVSAGSDGKQFKMFHTLEDEPGEYSYPAMIQAANGDLLITYTWHRKHIRYVRVPLSEVVKP